MTKIPFQKIVLSFWLLVCIDLLALITGEDWLHTMLKPLLIPALMLLLLGATEHQFPYRTLILTGLFFSWLGDVFLLLESYNSYLFIAGLSSFLITHLCYIVYFLLIKSGADSLIKKQPLYILLTLGYGVTLVWLLFPFLGDLKVPVMLYAAVICTMLLCSLHIFQKVAVPANRYFILGASLFVLSDSLLAINKFYQPLAFAATLVMLTYCAAQYFIVLGFIKRRY